MAVEIAPTLTHRAAHVASPAPAPFIKWVGGKGGLLRQLSPMLPGYFKGYHEPFVGGGAMFFATRPAQARLTDLNGRLIEAYNVLRDEPLALIERLEHHSRRHSSDHFYHSRGRFNAPAGLGPIDRAALFIYLNKTCFNGLYRENKSGAFNAPIGRYTRPRIVDHDGLLAASAALRGVALEVASFERVLDHAEPDDFVYFDPPYVPVSDTSRHTAYTGAGFGMLEQTKLAKTFAELAQRGCRVMLSNSDAPEVHELYRGWRVDRVTRSGAMNSKGGLRKERVGEVVVRSW